jgi:peptidoglycan hydrolase-like protein with peptidoglycan-binding domain
MGLTHILAHRQSSGQRENDPGPDIWYHVGQWAVDNLGLKDGGPGFKVGTGNPIPDLWRTWGRAKPQPELEAADSEDLEAEDSQYEGPMLESYDEELAEETWEGEVNRGSRDYIRWVQQSLNKILGLRLAVDGIIGSQTRSAIRSFQRRERLAVDGVVGSQTERALMAAGAKPPPGSGTSPGIEGTTAPSSASGAPQGPFGTLTVTVPGRRQFIYKFTPEDVLWTARFIVGEAGGEDNLENRAIIWAMFNRYAFFTHTVFPTFHAFLRRYSTTLQPVLQSPGAARRHMHRPEFVRTGGYYPNTNIPRGQLERHLKLQATPWHKLPQSARSLAESALRGQISNPGISNASEFANTAVYFKDRHKRMPDYEEWLQFTQAYPRNANKNWTWVGPVAGLTQYRINTFFIDNRVIGLPKNAVRIAPPG